MRYGSLCSGVEAASLAFEPLGWEPQWFSEIEPFCCRLLKQRWPLVPNLGDMTSPDFIERAGPVDLIIGGTPCPSFSLAGKRKGLLDNGGQLALRYCEILRRLQPRWFIWENVPGVLTSDNGKDFERILNEMVNSGYGVCWRVLDARCFGLPQSRRRLFVVGRLGNECPREVLVEPTAGGDLSQEYEEGEQAIAARDRNLAVIPLCLRSRGKGIMIEFMKFFGCLRANPTGGMSYIWDGSVVRKLTPLEYERLQGMPDNHTKIDGARDRQRWQAIGNSMAVPVIRWLGEQIQAWERRAASLV